MRTDSPLRSCPVAGNANPWPARTPTPSISTVAVRFAGSAAAAPAARPATRSANAARMTPPPRPHRRTGPARQTREAAGISAGPGGATPGWTAVPAGGYSGVGRLGRSRLPGGPFGALSRSRLPGGTFSPPTRENVPHRASQVPPGSRDLLSGTFGDPTGVTVTPAGSQVPPGRRDLP